MNAIERIVQRVAVNDRRYQVKWISVPGWLRRYEDAQAREWTPERDAYEEMMKGGDERPSGISGIDPRYFRVKAFLIQRGRQAIEIMRKRGMYV